MTRPILVPGRNCRALSGVSNSGLLVDGVNYYRAFYNAALRAKKYILISGWQFDSDVALLRGGGAEKSEDHRFLRFLNRLCERNRELRIYILAWDFSLIFMLEREWVQEWVFNWTTGDRLFFRFDNLHAVGASQHQKYVVIDGCVSFLGGMDLCAGRWDDRRHLVYNPERINPDGKTYEPYHDIQAYASGPAAQELATMFAKRWKDSTGSPLELPEPETCVYEPGGEHPLPVEATEAALSITQGQTLLTAGGPVQEIRQLYLDAINAADELIYIENQYLSSFAIYKALLDRMEAPNRPRLEIIIMLPRQPHGFLEELSLGITQSRLLKSLKAAAEAFGHRLGVYYSESTPEDEKEVPVYIHSKVLIVDDRFLSAGSANTTNRSMGIDNELNISWEARSRDDRRLIRSIRRIRVNLLAELTGVNNLSEFLVLARKKGLVDFLDSIADSLFYQLRSHGMDTPIGDSDLVRTLDALILDPEKANIGENIFELLSPERESLFSEGITYLKKWLLSRKEGSKQA